MTLYSDVYCTIFKVSFSEPSELELIASTQHIHTHVYIWR